MIAKATRDNLNGGDNARNAGAEANASAETQHMGADVWNEVIAPDIERATAELQLGPEIQYHKVLWASLFDLV